MMLMNCVKDLITLASRKLVRDAIRERDRGEVQLSKGLRLRSFPSRPGPGSERKQAACWVRERMGVCAGEGGTRHPTKPASERAHARLPFKQRADTVYAHTPSHAHEHVHTHLSSSVGMRPR